MPEPEKLSAAQRSKIRRLSAPKEVSPDEAGGELNIVPFLDIITNVLMFVLATISVTFTAMIDTLPPHAGGSGGRPPSKPSLSLNIVVINDGFIISALGSRVGPGCTGLGSGVAVGLKQGGGPHEYDYDKLNECANTLKHKVDDAADETSATITANKDIPYQVIISTMDALRKSATGETLFPDINFGVPK